MQVLNGVALARTERSVIVSSGTTGNVHVDGMAVAVEYATIIFYHLRDGNVGIQYGIHVAVAESIRRFFAEIAPVGITVDDKKVGSILFGAVAVFIGHVARIVMTHPCVAVIHSCIDGFGRKETVL